MEFGIWNLDCSSFFNPRDLPFEHQKSASQCAFVSLKTKRGNCVFAPPRETFFTHYPACSIIAGTESEN